MSAALENLGTDTTYLCCVDADGNACSFICSNFEAFGSGLAGGLLLLAPEQRTQFCLARGASELYRTGKRPYHTIIPGMVTDGGGLRGRTARSC